MKTLFFLFIGFFLLQQVLGQVITGTVIDTKTNEKVSYAAIYFSGTFVGTISDNEGNFKLDISKYPSMPLVVSCMGYYSQSLNDYMDSTSLIIRLEPKEFNVGEVTVKARSLVRKRKSSMRIFKKEFIGESINAGSCEIENEEDIFFNYESDRDTLKAFATKPLQIKNRALGYNITYFLDKFEYYRESKSFMYKGNIFFKEDELIAKKINKYILTERRNETYLGSRMHFLRSLWTNQLTAAGFAITSLDDQIITYNNIVIQKAGNVEDTLHQIKKFLSYPFSLKIYYGDGMSIMTIQKQRVYIDENGYNAAGIFWEGEMLKKRIGDALPYEYNFNTHK